MMAELFMECEEEELEPWQQKSKPIIVEDEDDDDEPIFVGEILSSKPANTYILNRVQPSSPRVAMQNGTPKRGFQPMARPATSTLAVQPQPRTDSLSGTAPGLQKPLPGGSSPQEAAKPSAGISPPVNRPAPTPSMPGNLSIPVMAQSAARPVATVTAQPAALNLPPPTNTSSVVFGIRQSSGASQCPSGAAVTGLAKRPAPAELNSVSPKKAKGEETGSGSSMPVSPSVKSPSEVPSLQKGGASCNTKNGASFPQACPKCNIHFNLLEPLKNHMKYCCPALVHTFLGALPTDTSSASAKMADSEKGKLIMLVNDFYYGKYEGNVQQVHQEQKTHTTFKCASCMKLLKNNIRFMNHMKHHLELEKQNSESWESHTTCQHCYRQFPTPFQLQCHIESTHTPHESSTICRICELSFETEQILLQHMKDNHRPGEMPYVCQVCNYRSSAFSDVEKHFRAVHENTKNLLCPFCLKVIKIGAPYMHHYMRHQKKGVHRCTKCRLQFLTCKEKMDHKSQHHRTFRKPAQLEGLPPGTKVTIRASAGSVPPGPPAMPAVGASTSTLQLSPNVKMTNTKPYNKLNVSKAKPKLKSSSAQQRPSAGLSSGSNSSSGSNKKSNKIANTALNRLRCSEIQKCIECSADIRTFASHFPAYVRCGLCRYGTSCSKAYVNHMMSFHSARQSKRFWIYKPHSEELRGITTVCLNCDLVMDDSGLDKMATHLNERQSHRCQVIAENGASEEGATEGLSHRTNDASCLSNEGEDKAQNLSRPDPPEGQEGTLAPASSGTKNPVEGTDVARVDPGDEMSSTDQQEEKASPPSQDGSSRPAPSKDPSGEGNEGCLEGQKADGSAVAGREEAASPSAPGPSSGLGGQTFREDPMESKENQLAEGFVAAEEGGGGCSSSVLEDPSGPGFSANSEDPRDTILGGGSPRNQLAEGTIAAESGKGSCPSISEVSSGPEPSASSEDPSVVMEVEGSPQNQLAEGSVAPEGGEGSYLSISEVSSGPEPSACSEDPRETMEEGSPQNQLAEGTIAAESGKGSCPSISGGSSGPDISACSEDPSEAMEVEGSPQNQLAEGSVAPEGGEGSYLSISEVSSGPGPSACLEDPRKIMEVEGSPQNQLAEGSVGPEGGESSCHSVSENPSGPGPSAEDPRETIKEEESPQNQLAEGSSISEDPSGPGPSAFSEDPREVMEEESPQNQLAEGSSISEDSSGPGPSAYSEDPREAMEEEIPQNQLAEGSCISEDPSSPEPPAFSEDPSVVMEVEETPQNQLAEGSLAPEGGEGFFPSISKDPSGSEPSAFSEDPRDTMEEEESPQNQLAESSVAPEGGEGFSPSISEDPSDPGPSAFSEDPREAIEEEEESPPNQLAEGSVVAEGGEGSSPSISEDPSGPGPSACLEDPRETAEGGGIPQNQLAEGSVAPEGGENTSPSIIVHSALPALAAHSEDLLQVSTGEGNVDSQEGRVAENCAVLECEGNTCAAEHSGLAPPACLEDLGASAEETESFGPPSEESCGTVLGGGDVPPSPPEPSCSHPGLSACSRGPMETAEEPQGGHPAREVKEAPGAADCLERMPLSLAAAGSPDAGLQAPFKGSADAEAMECPCNQAGQRDGSSPVPAAGDVSGPGAQPSPVEALPHQGAGCGDASGAGDHAGERRPLGDCPCPSAEDQQPASDVGESGLEDFSGQASHGDVSFEQFLRRRDEPESASSDVSEQGSVHLEPLTPSEVLEYEATEILQKGGTVAASSKASGPGSEQAEAGVSREGSPSHGEAAAAQAEETDTS